MSIFKSGGPERDAALKIVEDQNKLATLVDGLKVSNHKIVLTIGSWDVLHIGHCRYLLEASKRGDILIVGVDSDRAIKSYKGPTRPIVPEDERLEMLTYQAFVDVVTLVDDVNKNGEWEYGLLKIVKPDVFVAVEDSYPYEQQRTIREYASRLIVLPRQAENTSTSFIIQEVIKKNPDKIREMKENGELEIEEKEEVKK